MDNQKGFKHSAKVREYWRLEKRIQRARVRVAKEPKTEQNSELEANKSNV